MLYAIEESGYELSPSEQSRLARRALRHLLSEYRGLDTLPRICADNNGKPYFPEFPDIHFSISHCKIAVMAVIDSEKVGCDIEMFQHDFPNEAIDLAFSSHEKTSILNSEHPETEIAAIWTRKEAFVKRDGRIPDNPASWKSDDDAILTRICHQKRYAFSIAQTSSC